MLDWVMRTHEKHMLVHVNYQNPKITTPPVHH
jgi:hypothetical protein